MWLYKDLPFDEEKIGDNVGFVYIITNLSNGKKYIGKKLFTKSKTYQRNKKKRKTRVSSDWQTYTGSNANLNEDIKNTAPELEKRILHLCSTKGWLSFYETLEILQSRALQDETYYNEWCSIKLHRKHLVGNK